MPRTFAIVDLCDDGPPSPIYTDRDTYTTQTDRRTDRQTDGQTDSITTNQQAGRQTDKLVHDWIVPSPNFVAMATTVGPTTFCMVPLNQPSLKNH